MPSYSEVIVFDIRLNFKDGATSSLDLQFDADGTCASTQDLTEEEFMGAVLLSIQPDQVSSLVSSTIHLSDGWENAPEWVQEANGDLTIDLTEKASGAERWATFRDVFLADGAQAAKTDSGS